MNRIAAAMAFFLLFTGRMAAQEKKSFVLLYTNDFHSAFDPIPAYWLKDTPRLGGAAQLSTMINQVRDQDPTTFLFDAGDMFTGTLSNVTRGEILMEMMMSMHYDAMCIGNHEFDYGSANFSRQMNQVPFPVLADNIFYKGTHIPYSRPYTIIEKNHVRLGVIGFIGEDARSVTWQEGIKDLEFRDPIPITRAIIAELRPRVDAIVVISHEGKTGPQQSDAENIPEVQRDFDTDIAFCKAVSGIDVFIGGHAHTGIEVPYKEPVNGTLIVQTYGYGTRLGYLKCTVEGHTVEGHSAGSAVTAYSGELLKVWSDKYAPDPVIADKIAYYKNREKDKIGVELGRLDRRLIRDYRRESSLGCLVADVLRKAAAADVAFENAGGVRADIPAGMVTNGNVLDALPFLNTLVTCTMTGAQIKQVLEQGFTLERGMMQVSGLVAVYDMRRPKGHRLVSLSIGGQKAVDTKKYKVATNSFIGDGGDLYSTFVPLLKNNSHQPITELVIDYFKKAGRVDWPAMNRLVPLASTNEP